MKLYGLIGYPLSHSFSKRYFDEKFEKESIKDVAFENFSISDIILLKGILQQPGLCGFAITIPYKKEVIAFLEDSTEVVKQMGACNCVKIVDGKLYGFNTDVLGFTASFQKHLQSHHTKALILGTGGAAAAVAFALGELNIPYKFVSRLEKQGQLTYADLDEAVLKEYTIMINTTPLGTYPKVDDCPAIPYHWVTPQHYFFDLVYNPAETKFLRLAKEKGAITQNGYEMLVLQAEENWRIWNS
ncbi:MAG: shikimate dehydrogenase [Bacteroidota bacterium]|nr:shikimate dehydrogenase [Bacteroidota bacterium]